MAVQAVPAVAFLLPSGQEMIVLLVIGVLLFGRRLPEVGRQIGRVVTDLRRGVDKFKRELAQDESIRDARSGLRDLGRAADAPRKLLDAPRRIADPQRLFADLTDESRATPAVTSPAVTSPSVVSPEVGSPEDASARTPAGDGDKERAEPEEPPTPV